MAEQGFQWQDMDWRIEALPDGTVPPDCVTHALLMDVRAMLRQIRGMMRFFTWLAAIGLLVGVLNMLLRL